MYEILTGESSTSNFFAGKFDVVTAVEPVAPDTVIQKHCIVAKTTEGAVEVSSSNIADIIGISAEDSTDAGVVIYQTGEFQANGIVLPDGVEIEDVRETLRKLSIFLK